MGGFDYGGKMIYSPMMQQYLQTKDEYKDSILLYRLGDFYEMFFDDAIKASEILDLVLTSKVCGQKCKAPMCGIPYHAVDNYIAKLIEAGEKVAICRTAFRAQFARACQAWSRPRGNAGHSS